jgi:hypothetical protein
MGFQPRIPHRNGHFFLPAVFRPQGREKTCLLPRMACGE